MEPVSLHVEQQSVYDIARMRMSSLEVVGREKEREQLSDLIQNFQSQKQGGSIYVTGQPGVGKSVCINDIISKTMISNICINLAVDSFSGTLLHHVLEQMGHRRNLILVIEEADTKKHLKGMSSLYQMTLDTPLIIISTGNNTQFRGILNTTHVIVFSSYSAEELSGIAIQKMGQDLIEKLMDQNVIRLWSARISSSSGDYRYAFQILMSAIDIAEQQKTRVTSRGIQQSWANMRGDSGRYDELISSLPMNQKMLYQILKDEFHGLTGDHTKPTQFTGRRIRELYQNKIKPMRVNGT